MDGPLVEVFNEAILKNVVCSNEEAGKRRETLRYSQAYYAGGIVVPANVRHPPPCQLVSGF